MSRVFYSFKKRKGKRLSKKKPRTQGKFHTQPLYKTPSKNQQYSQEFQYLQYLVQQTKSKQRKLVKKLATSYNKRPRTVQNMTTEQANSRKQAGQGADSLVLPGVGQNQAQDQEKILLRHLKPKVIISYSPEVTREMASRKQYTNFNQYKKFQQYQKKRIFYDSEGKFQRANSSDIKKMVYGRTLNKPKKYPNHPAHQRPQQQGNFYIQTITNTPQKSNKVKRKQHTQQMYQQESEQAQALFTDQFTNLNLYPLRQSFFQVKSVRDLNQESLEHGGLAIQGGNSSVLGSYATGGVSRQGSRMYRSTMSYNGGDNFKLQAPQNFK